MLLLHLRDFSSDEIQHSFLIFQLSLSFPLFLDKEVEALYIALNDIVETLQYMVGGIIEEGLPSREHRRALVKSE